MILGLFGDGQASDTPLAELANQTESFSSLFSKAASADSQSLSDAPFFEEEEDEEAPAGGDSIGMGVSFAVNHFQPVSVPYTLDTFRFGLQPTEAQPMTTEGGPGDDPSEPDATSIELPQVLNPAQAPQPLTLVPSAPATLDIPPVAQTEPSPAPQSPAIPTHVPSDSGIPAEDSAQLESQPKVNAKAPTADRVAEKPFLEARLTPISRRAPSPQAIPVRPPVAGAPTAEPSRAEPESSGRQTAPQARTAEQTEGSARQAEAKPDANSDGRYPVPRLRTSPVAEAGDGARGNTSSEHEGKAPDLADRTSAARPARKEQPEAVTTSSKSAPKGTSSPAADAAVPPAEHKVEGITTTTPRNFGSNDRVSEPDTRQIQSAAPTVEIVEEPSKVGTGPATVELEVGEQGQQKVHLRVTERGGQVEVAMRTADSTLSRQMRAEIPELTSQLDRQGWKFEPLRREFGTGSAATLVTAPQQVVDSQNSGFSESPSRRDDTAHQMAQQSYGSGSGPDSRRNDWETWIDEIEKSLDGSNQGVWQ